MTVDLEFSILKTSLGMQNRFAFFSKSFGDKFYKAKGNEKLELNVTAIGVFYGVSKRVARQYYDLISSINKGELVKIRKTVGLE